MKGLIVKTYQVKRVGSVQTIVSPENRAIAAVVRGRLLGRIGFESTEAFARASARFGAPTMMNDSDFFYTVNRSI